MHIMYTVSPVSSIDTRDTIHTAAVGQCIHLSLHQYITASTVQYGREVISDHIVQIGDDASWVTDRA